MTRSYVPGSTDGAATRSARCPGSAASSAAQSQPSPVRYSQPRPTGGASERMLSNDPVARSTPTAVTTGSRRTRCWTVRVPARSA